MTVPTPPAAPGPPSAAPGRAAADWTAAPERSNLRLLRAMRWIAMSAGRRATRLLLPPIALYYLLANGAARRESRRYLALALRRPPRWTDGYRHIHHFASVLLDRVYFLQGRFDLFEVEHIGAEAIFEPLDRGCGVMLAGAHVGSFEALRATAQGRGAKVAMLMYEQNARRINATLAAVAPQAQLHTIGLGRPGAMLALREWLDDGGLAGLLADRTLPGAASDRYRSVAFDFLGRPARFSDGPFRLAALLKRPVVFMTGLYRGGNRYTLRFESLADFHADPPADAAALDQRVREALQCYVARLEAACLESPYNWFNFYDFWAAGDAPPTAGRAHESR